MLEDEKDELKFSQLKQMGTHKGKPAVPEVIKAGGLFQNSSSRL